MNAAREADKNRHVREAISLYEALVASGEAELIDFLNLIVLYFNCIDLGYASAHKVGRDIEKAASGRALELISVAEDLFGANDELLYWKSMIPFYGWGEPVTEWCLDGNSKVPYLYLAREHYSEANIRHVKDLSLQISDMEDSERKRYLTGEIEKVLKR